jgi:hypothetical protein
MKPLTDGRKRREAARIRFAVNDVHLASKKMPHPIRKQRQMALLENAAMRGRSHPALDSRDGRGTVDEQLTSER